MKACRKESSSVVLLECCLQRSHAHKFILQSPGIRSLSWVSPEELLCIWLKFEELLSVNFLMKICVRMYLCFRTKMIHACGAQPEQSISLRKNFEKFLFGRSQGMIPFL